MWAYPDQHSDFLSVRNATGLIPPTAASRLRRLNPVYWLWRWWRQETALTELYGLDDQTLLDLGITRGDFPAILSGRYERGQ